MATNPSSVKLRKLELKITRNDDDVIRFRREIFLEELKGKSQVGKSLRAWSSLCSLIISSILISTQISGSTMTGEGLAKIGQFIPRLEKVYLDDIFTDSNHLIDRYVFELRNVILNP